MIRAADPRPKCLLCGKTSRQHQALTELCRNKGTYGPGKFTLKLNAAIAK